MVFRSGKYAGMTPSDVNKVAPWYIKWVRENRPEMLKDHGPSKRKHVAKPISHTKSKAIKPNYEFAAEKPAPYLASVEEAFGMNFPKKETDD